MLKYAVQNIKVQKCAMQYRVYKVYKMQYVVQIPSNKIQYNTC